MDTGGDGCSGSKLCPTLGTVAGCCVATAGLIMLPFCRAASGAERSEDFSPALVRERAGACVIALSWTRGLSAVADFRLVCTDGGQGL